MAIGTDFQIGLPKIAIGIDYKAGAVPIHGALVFALAHACGAEEFVVRIGEQVDGEAEFVAEVFVRCNVVFADPNHGNICFVEFLFSGSKRFSLDCAAGRVIFWIDVNHEPLAREVTEFHCLSVLVLQAEIYKSLTLFN